MLIKIHVHRDSAPSMSGDGWSSTRNKFVIKKKEQSSSLMSGHEAKMAEALRRSKMRRSTEPQIIWNTEEKWKQICNNANKYCNSYTVGKRCDTVMWILKNWMRKFGNGLIPGIELKISGVLHRTKLMCVVRAEGSSVAFYTREKQIVKLRIPNFHFSYRYDQQSYL